MDDPPATRLLVHGVGTLPDYLRVAAEFTLVGSLEQIDCPTLLCAAQNDPLSHTASTVHDQLTAPATLLQFSTAEGAGDHCAMRNRALFDLRAFDWLDETLAAVHDTPWRQSGELRSVRRPAP